MLTCSLFSSPASLSFVLEMVDFTTFSVPPWPGCTRHRHLLVPPLAYDQCEDGSPSSRLLTDSSDLSSPSPDGTLGPRDCSPTLITPRHLTSSPSLPGLQGRLGLHHGGLQGSPLRVFKVVVIFISSSLWCNE